MDIKTITQKRIAEKKASIETLEKEKEELEERLKDDSTGIEKWLDFNFQSSTGSTDEWKAFIKDLRKYIKGLIKDTDWQLVGFTEGHFFFSSFLFNGEKYVYLGSSDVRFFRDEWYNNLLVRTAQHSKDYTGGRNNFCKLPELVETADRL